MTENQAVALIHFNHQELPNGHVGWTAPGAGQRHPNYGDMLVCAAIVRQLAPTETVRHMFGSEVTTPVRSAVLRGSTYLSREFDYERAIRTIESVDGTVAAVGLGAQSPLADPTFLDDVPEAQRFVKLLDERSTSISARGEFTATVLERLGARSVRVTGCPSMFYDLRAPHVSVPEALRHDQRRMGVSLKTGIRRNRFCRNPAAALRKQSRAIQFALRNSSTVSLFEQGTLSEHTVADATQPIETRIDAAAAILRRFPDSSWLQPRDLLDHMVSVRSVEEWLDRGGEVDAMIGLRFHGNMVALTQGVPCFYYVYDSRITEFCRVYRLPFLDVEQPWRNPVTAMLEHDWDDTNRAIQQCYDELVAFYEENGVQHTLTASGPRDQRGHGG